MTCRDFSTPDTGMGGCVGSSDPGSYSEGAKGKGVIEDYPCTGDKLERLGS